MSASTMRAARLFEYGDTDKALVKDDVPKPIPKSKEVVIRVIRAAVNPVDWKMVQGNLAMVDGGLPRGLGFDVAGVVDECGSSVTRVNVGDEVWAMASFRATGSFAEYFVMDESYVSRKPSELDWDQAAGFPLVGLTVYQSLLWAKVSEGSKVLVLGGSGGTGSVGLQIAKRLGAQTIAATCSAKNIDMCRDLGADICIDYNASKWWEELKGQDYDAIFDTVGGYESWVNAETVLKKGGSFVTIAGDEQAKLTVGRALKVGAASAGRKFMSLFGKPRYEWLMCKASGKQLDEMTQFFGSGPHGGMSVPIDSRYPLENIAEALAKSKSYRARGKIIIEVAEP